MFITSMSIKPAVGHINGLRDALKEVTEHRQQLGNRTSLAESIWTPDGATLRVSTMFESIAAIGEARSKGRDAKTTQLISKVMEHAGTPGSQSVWERIVAPPSPRPATFTLRVTLQPALGKAPEVRRIMSDWCNSRNEHGNSMALLEEVWGSRGVRFLVRLPFDSIAEAGASRSETLANPAYQKLASDLSTSLEQLAAWELMEIVVPMS